VGAWWGDTVAYCGHPGCLPSVESVPLRRRPAAAGRDCDPVGRHRGVLGGTPHGWGPRPVTILP